VWHKEGGSLAEWNHLDVDLTVICPSMGPDCEEFLGISFLHPILAAQVTQAKSMPL